MSITRASELYGANEGEIFIPRFQATILNAFNWLANFHYNRKIKRFSYEWDIHFDREAHRNFADRLDVETYEITGQDYEIHIQEVNSLIISLETTVKTLFNLNAFTGAQITEVTVSPRNEMLIVSVDDADGNTLMNLQKTAASGYHDLIAANPMTVFGIVAAARQYDLATRQRFINCVDVPPPSME